MGSALVRDFVTKSASNVMEDNIESVLHIRHQSTGHSSEPREYLERTLIAMELAWEQ